MKVINYWDKFLSTGNINDYLAYREGDKTAGLGENEGAGQGAGTDQCYRDDIKGRADWGI